MDAAVSSDSAARVDRAADVILECVRYLARAWRKSDSPALLTAGLPLRDGRLGLDQIDAAFGRIGVNVRRVTVAPDRLREFDFPALVFSETRPPMVLLARAGRRTFRAYDPAQQAEIILDGRDINAKHAQK